MDNKKTYKDLIKEINGSAKTSRNFVAAGFKLVSWKKGSYNFDLGGGRFEKSTEYLAKKGVTNLIYDPYNRSSKHNNITWTAGDEAETTTIFNVINVIPSQQERLDLIKQGKRKNTRTIYITAYEKDGTGHGSQTRDGWQNNMKLVDYLPEIQSIYPSAYIKKRMIIINV